MKEFHVLDRHQNIFQNTMLEASAGTGKTFSIENIVVRLIIEGLSLENILVVTFTRAATRDLKSRIHDNLLKAIRILKECPHDSQIDYLSEIIESGPVNTDHAMRKLERAVCSYDTAQIYTIHSFCAQNLFENIFEGDVSLDTSDADGIKGSNYIRKVIRDYFRGGIKPGTYSSGQLNGVLKKFEGKIEKLEKAIYEAVAKGISPIPQPAFPELLKQFNKTMNRLKSDHGISASKIMEDFEMMIPHYNGFRDTKRNLKPEKIEKLEAFAKFFERDAYKESDFDWLMEDQLSVVSLFNPKNLASKGKHPSELPLNYPSLIEILQKNLEQYISVNAVFIRMVSDCLQVLERIRKNDECLNHDDFLRAMDNALENNTFSERISRKYRAAVIDEFQDTDPLQWKIFKKLFLDQQTAPKPLLYLVGDPKQSIYAFRQADIYTYLEAAQTLKNIASLSTNYRSHPSLVHALNELFSVNNAPGLLSLPKINKTLEYPPVKPSPFLQERTFSDQKGSVHFCIAAETKGANNEKDYFLPFIAKEILHLVQEENFQFRDIAILISDRYQSARVHEYLNKWNIPSLVQRTNNISILPAYPAMRELLAAVINPKDESALKVALGGKIIRWTVDEVISLDEPETLEKILYRFTVLREELTQNGFASFLYKFLETRWKEDVWNVLERLLIQEGGDEFLQDFLQIAELLLEHENENPRSPESLLKYLDDTFYQLDDDDENAKKTIDPTKNAVQILTTHVSKGLEYDIVFTLGLVESKKSPETYFTTEIDGERVLAPVIDTSSPTYIEFCKEIDAEKIRQLYVAMTRARYRLYSPVVIPKDNPFERPGTASPMELFLASFKESHFESAENNSLTQFIDDLPSEIQITYSILQKDDYPFNRIPNDPAAPLIQPPEVLVPGVDRYIQSFTTLSHSHKTTPGSILETPRKYDVREKTAHTIPAGSEVGILLHECLENMPFHIYQGCNDAIQLSTFVYPYVAGTPFEEWKEVLCEMLLNAIQTPLNKDFSLAQVSPSCILKETEFLYASSPNFSPGYIKGFIDLFFEHDGKYYLLDWKSNWLGPEREDYRHENLAKAMNENGYFLQAQLYREAIKKYLRLVDDRPFEEIFGGFFYVFLRGLDRKASDQYGIFFYP